MNEAMFTREPWLIEGRTVYALREFPARHGILTRGNVFSVHVQNDNRIATEEELDANAHLIAAAPDLHAALVTFTEMWGSRDANSQSKAAQRKRAAMWVLVNAALAKARGETL